MHVRGKDMTYIAHYPGRHARKSLLSVPKYDFNWQITYELAKPKRAAEGHRDRSRSRTSTTRRSNKFNPDPTKDVSWGDQTWEEMMIGFWSTVVPVPVATSSQPQQKLKFEV